MIGHKTQTTKESQGTKDGDDPNGDDQVSGLSERYFKFGVIE